MEELLKSLISIQGKLCVPKSQFNNFGKYAYRSLEDIEAALKPLLQSHNCGIRFCDEIVEHSGRTFLKTTLFFFNSKGESISVTAEAEHASEKSGMDKSQITGAASSYARKYALNGLFAIDDTKDADTNEYQGQTSNPPQKPTKQAPKISRGFSTANFETSRFIPIVPNDKYAALKTQLNSVTDQDSLLRLYQFMEGQILSSPDSAEIRNLFSLRKKQLSNTNNAA